MANLSLMKTFMPLITLLGLIAVGAVLVFIGIVLSQYFELSTTANTALAAVSLSVVWLCWWCLENRATQKNESTIKRMPLKVLAWRIVGASIIVFGVFLYFGNRVGTFQTFPFAGTVVMAGGVFVLVFLGRSEA
jgi:hypothetical protein